MRVGERRKRGGSSVGFPWEEREREIGVEGGEGGEAAAACQRQIREGNCDSSFFRFVGLGVRFVGERA